jgi:hypothetical protein
MVSECINTTTNIAVFPNFCLWQFSKGLNFVSYLAEVKGQLPEIRQEG